ncbi:hypothetical protein C8R43DRAFT_1118941 [Mycena crocata]|nr:hypothetical protein C8R43DRAFT_1118941 [Mycena crocata]
MSIAGALLIASVMQIFTRKRLEDISWTTHFFEAPLLTRHEYTLVNIDTPIPNLLTDDGTTKKPSVYATGHIPRGRLSGWQGAARDDAESHERRTGDVL